MERTKGRPTPVKWARIFAENVGFIHERAGRLTPMARAARASRQRWERKQVVEGMGGGGSAPPAAASAVCELSNRQSSGDRARLRRGGAYYSQRGLSDGRRVRSRCYPFSAGGLRRASPEPAAISKGDDLRPLCRRLGAHDVEGEGKLDARPEWTYEALVGQVRSRKRCSCQCDALIVDGGVEPLSPVVSLARMHQSMVSEIGRGPQCLSPARKRRTADWIWLTRALSTAQLRILDAAGRCGTIQTSWRRREIAPSLHREFNIGTGCTCSRQCGAARSDTGDTVQADVSGRRRNEHVAQASRCLCSVQGRATERTSVS